MHLTDSRFLKALVALAAIVCLTAAPAVAALIDLTPAVGQANSVGAAMMADLLADPTAGVVVGDKVFTGFSYVRMGDMPVAADVRVLGFRDLNNNWGISLQGAFLDLPGGTLSDAVVRYMVEVSSARAALGFRIADANLVVHSVGLGDESSFRVEESFAEKPNEGLSAFATTLGAGPEERQLSDSVIFGTPVVKLSVVKQILAAAASTGNQPARSTLIDQSFSQIPEPTMLVMASLSAVAIAAARRRD